MATVDHIYSHFHPFRKRHEGDHVLACAYCNTHRSGFESLCCTDYVYRSTKDNIRISTSVVKKDPIERINGIFLAMNDFFIKMPHQCEEVIKIGDAQWQL